MQDLDGGLSDKPFLEDAREAGFIISKASKANASEGCMTDSAIIGMLRLSAEAAEGAVEHVIERPSHGVFGHVGLRRGHRGAAIP